MSTATLEKNEPQPEDVLTESYSCPRCQGAIAPECAHGKLEVDKQTGRTLREMGIWCEHCNEVFMVMLRIDPITARLTPAGAWKLLRGSKERAEFLSKVDHARGNIQLKKSKV